MAWIGYNKVDMQGFQHFLENFPKKLDFAVFQTITDSFFVKYTLVGNKLSEVLLNSTERGRVFNEHSEVRWRFDNEILHFTLLSEDDEVFNALKSHLQTGQNDILELKKEEEHKIILWGQRYNTDNDLFWFEKRIPRKLYYPVENNGNRVETVVVQYSEKANWNSKIYRFKEVCNV